MQMDPLKSIVPIMRIDQDGYITGSLGTGFIIGSKPVLLTAKHVLAGCTLEKGEKYCFFALNREGEHQVWHINEYQASPKFDIAAVVLGGTLGLEPLKIASTFESLTSDVFTFEFSSTRFEQLPDGKKRANISPFAHKGNVTRYYTSNYPEPYPTFSFTTSFPALRGASGAPVLRLTDLVVVGMLVANYEQHLLPAHIERVETEEGHFEEVKYFLPMGKAISAKVLVDYLIEIGVDPEVIP